MNINIIKTELGNGIVEVTFKYWEDCGCTAKTIKRTFDKIPTNAELIKSI